MKIEVRGAYADYSQATRDSWRDLEKYERDTWKITEDEEPCEWLIRDRNRPNWFRRLLGDIDICLLHPPCNMTADERDLIRKTFPEAVHTTEKPNCQGIIETVGEKVGEEDASH